MAIKRKAQSGDPLTRIKTIHTLGPQGTNCERAAREWFDRHNLPGKVVLHRTLEEAAIELTSDDQALLSCIVYPALHRLVFENLERFQMVDLFLMPTMDMVLASRVKPDDIRSVATHPAPAPLVPSWVQNKTLATSNAAAAVMCAEGAVDACITTRPTALRHGLDVVTAFGAVPMGFAIHTRSNTRSNVGTVDGAQYAV